MPPHHADAQRVAAFVDAIVDAFPLAPAERPNATSDATSEQPLRGPTRVVVVGAGPVGLMAALGARMRPAAMQSVLVVEKRTNYARDSWFDLVREAWTPTLDIVRRWGLTQLRAGFVEASDRAIIIRTQMLERALAKIALLAGGVDLLYGYAAVRLCHEHGHLVLEHMLDGRDRGRNAASTTTVGCPATEAPELGRRLGDGGEPTSRLLRVPFDVLLGCDGTESWTRAALRVPLLLHDTVEFGPDATLRVPNLHQGVLIAVFQPDSDGACPALAPGVMDDPWSITFALPNITAVFKRWFPSHCAMEIFFRHQLSASLWAVPATHRTARENASVLLGDAANAAPDGRVTGIAGGADPTPDEDLDAAPIGRVPWDLLLTVCNRLLASPIASVDELRDVRLARRPGPERGTPQESVADVTLFPIKIHRAAQYAFALNRGRAMALLFGDSAVTAHFRLGIGVNQAFAALPDIADMLDTVATVLRGPDVHGKLAAVVAAENARSEQAARAMAAHEVRIMFLEAYCGFLVGVDFGRASLWDTPVVYRVDREAPDYAIVGFAADSAWGADVRACVARERARIGRLHGA